MTALFSALLLRGRPQEAGTVTCICVRVCEREREREREREERERREREKRERERESIGSMKWICQTLSLKRCP